MRRAALAAIAAIPLTVAGCADGTRIDACKYAAVRRTVYATTISAADAYRASGHTLPPEALLGRQAAGVALAMLNARCPRATTTS